MDERLMMIEKDNLRGNTARKRPAAEKVLRSASDLFYRNGIAATGVDTIVEHAGVSKRTLYNNFGGKDELVAAYLRDRDARWRTSLEEITNRYEDPKERLLATFEAYGEWLVGDDYRGCAFINAASEIADPDHPARAVALSHKKRVQEHLASLAAQAGLHEPETLAEELLLLLEGAMVTASMRKSQKSLNTARATAQSLVGRSHT
ncbi:MAG: TetR/AcrR family transcriptional regulator [Actinomycetota bacterium]|nr:TetR/AcrR family transcriptional regulator [Actinomycetota bacterium]